MDNHKEWANDAIGYIDLVLKNTDPEGPPISEENRRYLTNARLILQKITEGKS